MHHGAAGGRDYQMRLICPNCDVQYEVEEAAIPEGGREVLCSACDHGWFADGPAPAHAMPPAQMRRRALDDAVVNILREEAERETRVRRVEADETDTAPEPAPEDRFPEPEPVNPEPEEPEVEKRTWAVLVPADPEPGQADAVEPEPEATVPARRHAEMFPNIEEITSSLNAATPAHAGKRTNGRWRGFGVGFGFVAGAAGMLVALYLLAPYIVQQWPALDPHLSPYVAQVENARFWIYAMLR